MTEEEKTEEIEATESWTMDDLVALTDEVQIGEVEFRGKVVEYQFCELVEKEEPKFRALSDRASEDEKMAHYTEIGSKSLTKTGISGLRYLKFLNDSEQNGNTATGSKLYGKIEIANGQAGWLS